MIIDQLNSPTDGRRPVGNSIGTNNYKSPLVPNTSLCGPDAGYSPARTKAPCSPCGQKVDKTYTSPQYERSPMSNPAIQRPNAAMREANSYNAAANNPGFASSQSKYYGPATNNPLSIKK